MFLGAAVAEDGEVWIDVEEPIIPDQGPLVQVNDRIAARSLIRALLFGPAAEDRYSFGMASGPLLSCPQLLSSESAWRALNIARRLGQGQAEAEWHWVTAKVDTEEVWRRISAVAQRLLDTGCLDAKGLQDASLC